MEIGTELNQYRVTGTLGAGGMGEVYRAEDTRLKRDVAIKVLPADVAADAERLARMEREAQLLAALNHPNIAAIHGFETATIAGGDTIHFLAMELVEGENLSERLRTGPLTIERAIEFAAQIASGLEAAHEKGIVHRDLKPSNVQITPDGRAKVLDFGLAKAYDADGGASDMSPELTASPTILAATQTGVILGTAAYMSPEQARGKPVDKRTDIWAFGCVLFEMLVAQKPFGGETITDVIAAIIRAEPDLDKLPGNTPVRLRALLERCLAKDPRERLRDIGDARIELEHAHEEPEALTLAAAEAGGGAVWRRAGVGLVLGLMLGLTAGVWLGSNPEPPVVYMELEDEARFLGALAVAPDGRGVVYWAGDDKERGLRWREFSTATSVLLSGTEISASPFFAEDGETLYFVSRAEVKMTSVAGGTPVTVARSDASRLANAVYAGGETMYARAIREDRSQRLERIDLGDGSATPIADFSGQADAFYPAQVLPGGDALLGFRVNLVGPTPMAETGVEVLVVADGERHRVLDGYGMPRYDAESGQLLVIDGDGRLLTIGFDPATFATSGAPVPRIEDLRVVNSRADYALGRDGTLVFVSGEIADPGREIIWLDREGRQTLLTEKRAFYDIDSRLSRDGRLIALERSGDDAGLWIHDIQRDTQTPLWPGSDAGFPVWSADGRQIAAAERGGDDDTETGIFLFSTDRSAPPVQLTRAEEGVFHLPMDWSPDGSTILFLTSPSYFRFEGGDIWTVRVDGSEEPQPLLATPAHEIDPRYSPDGRWIAYQSDQSGRAEVYVRPATAGGGEIPISPDGGYEPLWNPAGRELFFRSGGRELMVVEIESGEAFSAAVPRSLFAFPEGFSPRISEPDPAGQRFMMLRNFSADGQIRLEGILNWRTSLER